MNTEEAIKSVEDTYNIHENDRSCNDVETERIFKERDEVITLLQRGEKYKKMWEYIRKHPSIIGVDILEQKYFPKELPDEKTTKL